MRLNTGRTPAARRRLATSAAARSASSPSRSSEKPFFLSSSSALASFGRPSLRTTASHSTSCSISRRNHGSYFEAWAISSTDRPWRNAWAITRMRSGVGRDSAPTIAALSGAPLISISFEAGQAGLHRAQRLLQRLLEGPADRHRLAHALHRGGEHRLGAGELLEGEARHLGDDVVDRRLEGRGRRAGDVVQQLVERVADREPRGDLGDREAGRLRGQRRGARHARVHLDHDHAARLPDRSRTARSIRRYRPRSRAGTRSRRCA